MSRRCLPGTNQIPSGPSRRQSHYSSHRTLDAELASHVYHHLNQPGLPLPPVECSRQLPSSPVPSPTTNTIHRIETHSTRTPSKPSLDLEAVRSTQPTQSMQTPPPSSTLGRKSQKKASRPINTSVSVEPSTIAMSSAKTTGTSYGLPNDQSGVSPSIQQFSPDSIDIFGYPLSARPTATTMPQNKLFWDPESSMNNLAMDFSGPQTATFGGARTHPDFSWLQARDQIFQENVGSMNVPASQYESQPQEQASQAFSASASVNMNTADRATMQYGAVTSQPSTSGTVQQALDGAVNPNLLFSFSSSPVKPITTFDGSSSRADKFRRPYQHQLDELQREQGLNVARRERKQRVAMGLENIAPTQSSKGHKSRPSMKRSVTDGSIQARVTHTGRQAQVSFAPPLSSDDHDSLPIARKSSLSKRRRESSNEIQEESKPQTRAAITFSIDPSGRARTETKVVPDEGVHHETKTVWDDAAKKDGSDSSSDSDLAILTSRNPSFTFPTNPSRKPKLARFSADSSQRRSGSRTSFNFDTSFLEDQIHDRLDSTQIKRTKSPVKKDIQRRRHSSSGFTKSFKSHTSQRADLESDMENVSGSDDAQGDAQAALREVLEKRVRAKGKHQLPAQGQLFIQDQSSPFLPNLSTTTPNQRRPFSSQAYNQNLSPTTVTDPDIATPSTDRDSQASDGTRCVCNVPDSGGHLMIQWYVSSVLGPWHQAHVYQ